MPYALNGPPGDWTSKAVDNITPIKLFSTNNTTRVGWQASFGTCTSIVVYFAEVPEGSTAPTFADIVTNGKYIVDYLDKSGSVFPPNPSAGMPSGRKVDVYAVAASGSGTIWVRELLP